MNMVLQESTITLIMTQESDTDEASVLAEQDANSTESDNTVTRTSEQMINRAR